MRLRTFLLRDQPLTIKLFVFSTILVVIPMLIVGAISYQRSAAVIEAREQEHSWQLIEQIKTHIEYYVGDFEVSMLKIINHPEMVKFLRQRAAQNDGSAAREALRDMLRNSAYSRPDISNVTLIMDDGDVIDAAGTNEESAAAVLASQEWYKRVPLNGEFMLVSRIIPFQGRREPVISLVRRIHSPQTLEPVGMLIMDINFRRIREISDKASAGGSGHFYIIDDQGRYVYHSDAARLGEKAGFFGAERLPAEGAGSFVTGGSNPLLLTYSYTPQLAWRFVTAVPYAELTRSAAHIGQTIFWTVLATLIVAYGLGVAFATTIVGPIRRLQQHMKNVEVGDFSVRVAVEAKDEIGQLSRGFNTMSRKLAELMEEIYFTKLRETEAALRQKEMELKVLQSQINPHFLGNSLETIRGMALDRNMEDIAAMAASLGQILRYNLRNHSPTVSLREELRFCQVYLQIQQFRFENRFVCEMAIPDWALDLTTVKFSLQPLVENCFRHGLSGLRSTPLRISIAAVRETETTFVIEVADTGPGMDEETLAGIQRRLDVQEPDAAEDGNHIGIINVHRRIRHVFGADYGVTIASRPGGGTTVRIRLPVRVRD